MKITNDFKEQIRQTQRQDTNFQHTLNLVQSGKLTDFTQDKESIWQYWDRVCIPKRKDL